MTSREQFEAEYSKMMGTPIGVLKVLRAGDVYSETEGDRLSIAWWAWQASREAVELDIDWPEANDDTWKDGEEGAYAMGHEDGKDKVVIAVREAIRAAGIKVKGE